MKKFILILAAVAALNAYSQQSIVKAPRDSTGTILYGGLGLPYVVQPSISVTSYNVSTRQLLSITGPDTGRQYRSLAIYNSDASETVYVCAGDSTGCSRDMWFAPPGVGFVGDFGYFGQGNGITYLYFRVSGGTVSPTVSYW